MDVKFEFIAVTVLAFTLDLTSTRSNVLRELPSQNDTFESIRKQNKVYVDKSSYITKLLESEDKFFIMCRPGRFGKSHFLQMLKSFFEGRKELFKGLEIYEKHDWRTSYPVIYLDMNLNVTIFGFYESLRDAIIETGRSYGMKFDRKFPDLWSSINRSSSNIIDQFIEFGKGQVVPLLHELIDHITEHGKRQIVVLIDEYDWPARQTAPRHGTNFNRYKIFQQTMQDKFIIPLLHQFERIRDQIRLLFVTCTVKMNYTTNIECPIPPLKDITFDPRFTQMIGLTGEELETNFRPHIDAIRGPEETFHDIVQKLRERYNGYCFTNGQPTANKCRLYNFHSVISRLRDRNGDYLWHPAADPKYNIIDDYSTAKIEEVSDWFEYILTNNNAFSVSRKMLNNTAHQTLGRDEVPLVACMVLYGYLTLGGFDEKNDNFIVNFPNEEMRESFSRALLKIIYGRDLPTRNFVEICKNLMDSLKAERAEGLVELLNNVTFRQYEYNKIRSEDWLRRYSTDRIAGIFRACELSLGQNLPEQYGDLAIHFTEKFSYYENEKHYHTYDGLQIELPNQFEYWIHFEFNRSAASATNMLLKEVSKNETSNYLAIPVHLMGINFNERTDEIKEWIRMTYAQGKCEDLQASHSQYLKMYSYVTDVQAYSPLP